MDEFILLMFMIQMFHFGSGAVLCSKQKTTWTEGKDLCIREHGTPVSSNGTAGISLEKIGLKPSIRIWTADYIEIRLPTRVYPHCGTYEDGRWIELSDCNTLLIYICYFELLKNASEFFDGSCLHSKSTINILMTDSQGKPTEASPNSSINIGVPAGLGVALVLVLIAALIVFLLIKRRHVCFHCLVWHKNAKPSETSSHTSKDSPCNVPTSDYCYADSGNPESPSMYRLQKDEYNMASATRKTLPTEENINRADALGFSRKVYNKVNALELGENALDKASASEFGENLYDETLDTEKLYTFRKNTQVPQ